MRVFVIRHGEAEPGSLPGHGDAARALTPQARQVLPGHFAALKADLLPLELVLMSPLVRAVQTATLLAQAVEYPGPLRTAHQLEPEGDPAEVARLLRTLAPAAVALVGHQPCVSGLLQHFLGVAPGPGMAPGTVVGLDWPAEGAGALRLVAPVGGPVQRKVA